jgi:hypothetical protein
MAFAAACTGKMAPVSLLTSITLTNIVFSSMAFWSCSSESPPDGSGFKKTNSKPCFSSSFKGFSTESCSTAVVTIRFPRRFPASAAPNRARLLASVPPEVNTSSPGLAPSREAITPLAASSS